MLGAHLGDQGHHLYNNIVSGLLTSMLLREHVGDQGHILYNNIMSGLLTSMPLREHLGDQGHHNRLYITTIADLLMAVTSPL